MATLRVNRWAVSKGVAQFTQKKSRMADQEAEVTISCMFSGYKPSFKPVTQ